MTDRRHLTVVRPRCSTVLLAVALAALVAATGAAGDRVVLGEYFTNLY